MTRKLYVKSYGCQMNVYDSHRMADTLAPEGFTETATPDEAERMMLHTSHIAEKALEQVGASAQIISKPEQIEGADKIILPGVGAFKDAIAAHDFDQHDQQ